MSTQKPTETATGTDLTEMTNPQNAVANDSTEFAILASNEVVENNQPPVILNARESPAKAIKSKSGTNTVTKKKVKSEQKTMTGELTSPTSKKAATTKAAAPAIVEKKTKTQQKITTDKFHKPAAKKDANTKELSIGSKKIKLAATCYHYYRNWLKDFMRSHGVASARFSKAPDSYKGHLTCAETDKAKGLKALEQWSKENPETKEMFWDVKK